VLYGTRGNNGERCPQSVAGGTGKDHGFVAKLMSNAENAFVYLPSIRRIVGPYSIIHEWHAIIMADKDSTVSIVVHVLEYFAIRIPESQITVRSADIAAASLITCDTNM
jgi:hypothetical protein